MSQSDEILTGTIDEYLLSIADGIEKAQTVLSKVRVPGQPGAAPTTYTIPSLEFELKMHVELFDTAEPAAPGFSRLGAGRTVGPNRVMRLAAPRAGAAVGRSKNIGEATSIIKGRFVSVPADGGQPRPLVRSRIEKISARRLKVVVTVRSNTGQAVPGVEVNFNLDREATAQLNGREEGTVPDEGTDLSVAVGSTDANGHVDSELIIAAQEPAGLSLVILVDALGDQETLVYEVV